MGDERLRCAFCDEVIGVYEPVLVVDGPRVRATSWLREPDLNRGQTVMHYHCTLARLGDDPEA